MPDERKRAGRTWGQDAALALAWGFVFIVIAIVVTWIATPTSMRRAYSCQEIFGAHPRLNYLAVLPAGWSVKAGSAEETVYDEHGSPVCLLNNAGAWERRGAQWKPL